MNKNLKFRAWLKPEKKMVDVREINFAGEQISFETNEDILFAFFDEIKLMQYTGLKDKNGVEIYDGDIVKVHYEYAYDGYVEGSTLCVVKHVDGWCRVIFQYLYDKDGNYYSVEDLDMNDVEIVGNIYENKELLNENN